MKGLPFSTIIEAVFGALIIVSLMLIFAIGEDNWPQWLKDILNHDRLEKSH
jgi:hypothetical protein